MLIKNYKDLISFADTFKNSLEKQSIKVLVCAGTGCLAGGSLAIYEKIKKLVKENGLLVDVDLLKEEKGIGVKKSGCHGFCEAGPLIRIEPFNYLYLHVKLEDCEDIVNHTLINGTPVERLMYKDNNKLYKTQEEIPFYQKQTRIVLGNCGNMDAENIQEYISKDGYKAAAIALTSMDSKEICKQISDSGLRGRGGGGYLAGKKWSQVLSQNNPTKYVVCNGDEGDPGAFMDRSIMEGDPHKIIEGMLIGGFSTKANTGYIYVRAEYPMAVERLRIAINQAREYGLLGENILGSGFDFDIHINQGAGAFVCGEGSALTASIEGERGMPRVKPPRTVEQGLFGCPTVLNNVETFANVPIIILNGVEEFKKYGTKNSSGTKAFALTGNVVNTGLIEVPMGTTLRDIIFDIGGGIPNGKSFKAVQIGGPSGGCLTFDESYLDLPLSFDSLKKVGAMIGSGGMVVMDEDTCMVEVARFFMSFTQRESCGKCIPCREGTKRMLEILEKIVAGNGTVDDLELLKDIADTVKNTALCGLGKTAANPVLSTLNLFHDEYLAHVVDKVCPAKVCKGLSTIYIDANLCKGCSKCARNCPVDAISGKVREPFVIDSKKCIKCGACIEVCSFRAILEV
ncbi:NADH-quinone oxidoreductase subunit F [Sedimentibacter acidaminivorans]|uniref:NADH-quinone oxidoreductase subunit F n=1 Tax=Sedimentibacter acidaminivorans TaxID=913099 RepID=A0ABS4GB54_9FIRM|nr:NADH-quinone oxidoreductase subunit NuoF [Sedimentibacter acidaminivorans]MBP1924906.1 NADH-quinone oxidoreductase subunit F [Sedimentibacter acidaminivorans]